MHSRSTLSIQTRISLIGDLSDPQTPNRDKKEQEFRRTYEWLLYHWADAVVRAKDGPPSEEAADGAASEAAAASSTEQGGEGGKQHSDRSRVCAICHMWHPRIKETADHEELVDRAVNKMLAMLREGRFKYRRDPTKRRQFRKYLQKLLVSAARDYILEHDPKRAFEWSRRHLPYDELMPLLAQAFQSGATWEDVRRLVEPELQEWFRMVGVSSKGHLDNVLFHTLRGLMELYQRWRRENPAPGPDTPAEFPRDAIRDRLRKAVNSTSRALQTGLFDIPSPAVEVDYMASELDGKYFVRDVSLWLLSQEQPGGAVWARVIELKMKTGTQKLSSDEIARQLNRPSGAAVDQLYQRAKDRLAEIKAGLWKMLDRLMDHLKEKSPELAASWDKVPREHFRGVRLLRYWLENKLPLDEAAKRACLPVEEAALCGYEALCDLAVLLKFPTAADRGEAQS